MRPTLATGAKTAERAPTTIRALPACMRRHSSWRSPSESLEWSTATCSPKRPTNTSTSCVVRAISGTKTEVYLNTIAHTLAAGRSAIVLVPEIALTTQVVDVFVGRFGEQVAVLHSKLSEGERHDEWRRMQAGKARIVVGARSAIFAPVSNVGLIVLDEEHEASYKQENSPRYNAKEMAKERARLSQATLVLGSATPSLESYFATEPENAA